MTKIFSADYRRGTFIDSVNKIVGVPTSLSKLIRTEKGTALARAVNHNGVTYTTGSKSLSKFTIVAWIKQRTTDDSDRYCVAFIGKAQIIRRELSSIIYSNYFNDSILGQLSVPTSTSLNKWMQFVVTYDGASLISSINNKQLVGSPSSKTATLDYTSIIIGRGANASRYSDSDILKFEVYDDVIGDKELELDYKALLESQITEKPIRGFELVKPTDLSMYKEKLGENVILNGGFDSSDNWLSTGDVDISGGVCKITRRNTSPNSVVYQINNLVVGKKYRCSFDTVDSSGSPVIRLVYGSTGSPDVLYTVTDNAGVNLNNLGRHEYDFIALSHTIGISNPYGSGSPYISIDNFACQELTGLVAAYNMIPSNGTLVDISGNGNNGTINGAVIQSKEGLFTTDTTSNVLISAGPIITTNTYSVLGRIKINDLMASDGVLFSNGNTTTNEIIDSIGIKGGKLSWNYDTGGTYKAGATTDLPLNSYVDFAFVSDGGRSGVIKLYINGVEDTITSTGFYRSGAGSRLFARSSGTGFLGDCADFRIYNRVLSEQEIKDYHNSFIKPVILEDFNNYSVGETRPKEWQIISGEFEIKEDTEKKYLECTSTGTIKINHNTTTDADASIDYYDGASWTTFSGTLRDLITTHAWLSKDGNYLEFSLTSGKAIAKIKIYDGVRQ